MLSPLDDRYIGKIKDITDHFSNFNFTKYKLFIEIQYFKFITQILDSDNTEIDRENIDSLTNFTKEDYNKINQLEKKTNHDIQALIDFIKSKNIIEHTQWIHFGLTSQDINSPSMVLMYRDFNDTIFKEDINLLLNNIKNIQEQYGNINLLTFTHGQPATPSNFNYQFEVYASKIRNISNDIFKNYTYRTKVGGSNGQLSSLKMIYPQLDWDKLFDNFTAEYFFFRKK